MGTITTKFKMSSTSYSVSMVSSVGSQMKFCSNCGYSLELKFLFCPDCGTATERKSASHSSSASSCSRLESMSCAT